MLVHKFHFRVSGQHLSQAPKCGSWKEPRLGRQESWVPVNIPTDFYKLRADDHVPGASTERQTQWARMGHGKRPAQPLWSTEQPTARPAWPGQG